MDCPTAVMHLPLWQGVWLICMGGVEQSRLNHKAVLHHLVMPFLLFAKTCGVEGRRQLESCSDKSMKDTGNKDLQRSVLQVLML